MEEIFPAISNDEPIMIAHMNPKALQQIFKMMVQLSNRDGFSHKDSQHASFNLTQNSLAIAFETKDKTTDLCIFLKENVMYDAITHPNAFRERPNRVVTFRIEDLEDLIPWRAINKGIKDEPIKRKKFRGKKKTDKKSKKSKQRKMSQQGIPAYQQQQVQYSKDQRKFLREAQSLKKRNYPLKLNHLVRGMDKNVIEACVNDRQTDYIRDQYLIFREEISQRYQLIPGFQAQQDQEDNTLDFNTEDEWEDIEGGQKDKKRPQYEQPQVFLSQKRHSYLMLLRKIFRISLQKNYGLQIYLQFFEDRIKVICANKNTSYYVQNEQYATIPVNLLGSLQWREPDSQYPIALIELHDKSIKRLISKLKLFRIRDLWMLFDSTKKQIVFGGKTRKYHKFEISNKVKRFDLLSQNKKISIVERKMNQGRFQRTIGKVPNSFGCKAILVFNHKMRMYFGQQDSYCQILGNQGNPRKRYRQKYEIQIDLAFDAISFEEITDR